MTSWEILLLQFCVTKRYKFPKKVQISQDIIDGLHRSFFLNTIAGISEFFPKIVRHSFVLNQYTYYYLMRQKCHFFGWKWYKISEQSFLVFELVFLLIYCLIIFEQNLEIPAIIRWEFRVLIFAFFSLLYRATKCITQPILIWHCLSGSHSLLTITN